MKWTASQAIRTLLQLLASMFGGVLLGVIGGFAGSALGRGSPGGWGDLIGGILLGALGYVLGAGLGAFLAGARLGQKTSWWLALAASVGAGILVLALAEPLRLNGLPELMQAVFVIAAPLAATFVPRLLLRRNNPSSAAGR